MAERTTVTVVKVGSNSGDAVSWTAYLDDVTLNMTRQELEAGTLAAPTAFVSSDASVDIPLSGPFTNAQDTIMGPIFDAPDTAKYVEIGPAGSSSGDPKYYTSAAYLKDYKIAMAAKGVIKWTGTLRVIGAMTRTTYT